MGYLNRIGFFDHLAPEVDDELVVCNIGHPSQELYGIQDRPR